MILAEILRRHWPDYLKRFGSKVPSSHRAAVRALISCHTPAQGGSLYQCDGGHFHFTYHGCGHRACPQCGNSDDWIARQTRRLLPVPYFLVTFTVPEALRMPIRSHQRLLLDLLFQESSSTLQDVAADPKHLGGELALLGALHTWSRQLIYHPHIHYIVPGIGLHRDGSVVSLKKPDFLLPVQVLSARFRNRFRLALQERCVDTFEKIPKKVWEVDWVVHSQSVGSGKAALLYLSRYIHRTAISAERQLQLQGDCVRFTYRDSKTRSPRTATLPVLDFIARFLQHVLPKRFRRIRTYGWLSPAAKKRFISLCAMLDALPACAPTAPAKMPVTICCRECQRPMRLVCSLERAPP